MVKPSHHGGGDADGLSTQQQELCLFHSCSLSANHFDYIYTLLFTEITGLLRARETKKLCDLGSCWSSRGLRRNIFCLKRRSRSWATESGIIRRSVFAKA
eukprot:scaffold15373_cov69-Cylindrotheca_fusiformis.AAC.1